MVSEDQLSLSLSLLTFHLTGMWRGDHRDKNSCWDPGSFLFPDFVGHFVKAFRKGSRCFVRTHFDWSQGPQPASCQGSWRIVSSSILLISHFNSSLFIRENMPRSPSRFLILSSPPLPRRDPSIRSKVWITSIDIDEENEFFYSHFYYKGILSQTADHLQLSCQNGVLEEDQILKIGEFVANLKRYERGDEDVCWPSTLGCFFSHLSFDRFSHLHSMSMIHQETASSRTHFLQTMIPIWKFVRILILSNVMKLKNSRIRSLRTHYSAKQPSWDDCWWRWVVGRIAER